MQTEGGIGSAVPAIAIVRSSGDCMAVEAAAAIEPQMSMAGIGADSLPLLELLCFQRRFGLEIEGFET